MTLLAAVAMIAFGETKNQIKDILLILNILYFKNIIYFLNFLNFGVNFGVNILLVLG